MKSFIFMSFCSILLLGCGKDQNLVDYQRDQLQNKIAQLKAVSGDYAGFAISKDGKSNLGAVKLHFDAIVDVQPSAATMSNTQNVTVGGSLTYRSITSSQVSFSNGTYDDITGDFRVTISVIQENREKANLYLHGQINGDQWNGSIEVLGQPEFGAVLNLSKNQPLGNTSSLEVTGNRMEQIKRATVTKYKGEYIDEDQKTRICKLSFNPNNSSPELSLYKLVSPVNYVSLDFEIGPVKDTFSTAILDDTLGTIDGHNPTDDEHTPVNANLHCVKFGSERSNFGYDCIFQNSGRNVTVHLTGN